MARAAPIGTASGHESDAQGPGRNWIPTDLLRAVVRATAPATALAQALETTLQPRVEMRAALPGGAPASVLIEGTRYTLPPEVQAAVFAALSRATPRDGRADAASEVHLSPDARALSSLPPMPQTPSGAKPRLLATGIPLLDVAARTDPVPAAAQRLQHAVASSGLFYESHVVQWAEGRRTEASLRTELQAAPQEADPAPRIAAQLQVLSEQAVGVTGDAWAGQPFALLIERRQREGERDGERDRDGSDDARAPATAEPTRVVAAELQVVLENLGPVQARFRLAGTTLALSLDSSAPSLRAALPQLRERLAARGLTVVALEMEQAPR
jgi:hypothetical protein